MVIEGNTPSSSQPSVGETLSLYEQYGDAPLLNITVADGLSGTYQTASAAAQNMPEEKRKNITVINSGTLCGPHRYLVQKALSLAKEGLSTEEILNALAPSLGNHRSFLIPNDFDFLRRGGRLTPLAAKVGGLLKLIDREMDAPKGTIRPDDIVLLEDGAQEENNVIEGTVTVRTYLGKSYQYKVATPFGDLVANGSNTRTHEAGERVRLYLPPQKLVVV